MIVSDERSVAFKVPQRARQLGRTARFVSSASLEFNRAVQLLDRSSPLGASE